MGTYLSIVQDMALETGTLAGPQSFSTLNDATGRLAKLAAWCNRGYRQLQIARRDWAFREVEFSKALSTNTKRYTASSFGFAADFSAFIGDFGDRYPWSLYETSGADETVLREIPYHVWHDRYDRGVPPTNRPHEYAISPAGELCVGAVPDKTYTIRGLYRKGVDVLENDGDVPIIPADHHDAIMWNALRLLDASDEALEGYPFKDKEWKTAFRNLVDAQTPNITVG